MTKRASTKRKRHPDSVAVSVIMPRSDLNKLVKIAEANRIYGNGPAVIWALGQWLEGAK